MQPFESQKMIETYVKVFESGSLTLAAEELRTTTAVISKRLKLIESDLEITLFHRTTRSLSPTEDGKRLYDECRKLLPAIYAARDAFHGEARPKGLVRVTASATFARLFLQPLIKTFLKTHPDVRLALDLSDRTVDLVGEGIDIGVRIGALEDSSLVVKKLASDTRQVCAAPHYLAGRAPLTIPEQLRDHNCLVLNGNDTWRFSVGKGLKSVKVSGSFETNMGESLYEAVKAGLGLGVLSRWLTADAIARGELVTVLDEFELLDQRTIYLVYPAARYRSTAVRSFANFLEANLKIPS